MSGTALFWACAPDRQYADDGSGGMGQGGDGSGGTGGSGAGTGGSGAGSGDSGGSGSGGAPNPGNCAGETYDHDGNPDTACASWTDCDAGEFVSEDGTFTEDRECGICGPGTFSATQNAAECSDFTECQPGQYIEFEGTTTGDQRCEDCGPGTFSDEEDAASCTDCPDGTFSDADGADACEDWRVCGWSETLVTEGTPEADTVCGVGSPYRQFGTSGGDGGGAIAVDALGNVYFGGGVGGEVVPGETGVCLVRKYDPSGAIVWTDQFGPFMGCSIRGIGVDDAGNVYVGGNAEGSVVSGGSIGGADLFVRKYFPNGTPDWTDQFGTSSTESGGDTVVSPSGNVYIVGATLGVIADSNQGGTEVVVRKYFPTMEVDWTHQVGGSLADFADGVAIDASGAVYVAGRTNGSYFGANAGGYDAFFQKFDTDGMHGPNLQFGTSGDDAVNAVAVDATGNAFLVGSTTGAFVAPSAGGQDAFLAKLDTGGDLEWTRQFGTAGTEDASGITLDGSGGIYITGYTAGALVGSNLGSTDAFIQRYDSGGNTPTPFQFGTSGAERSNAIAFDGFGRVFVTGSTDGTFVGVNAGSTDAFIMEAP